MSKPLVDLKDLILNGDPEIFRWEDDEIALRAAASNSRLPWNQLSEHELEFFPEVKKDLADTQTYLFIRNKILQLWLQEPNVEMKIEDALQQMPYPYNTTTWLIRRVHAYLIRYGYINYGKYFKLKGITKVKHRVLIIGAGAAGMAAFSQLDSFGFDVQVLEARNRIGGRIHSFENQKTKGCGELGAANIMGFAGNPLSVLARQNSCVLNALSDREVMFDEKGQPLNEHTDRITGDLYVKLMSSASFLSDVKGIGHVGDEALSLESLLQNLLKLVELQQSRTMEKFWETYLEIVGKRMQVIAEQCLLKKTCTILYAKLQRLEQQSPKLDPEEALINDLLARCHRKDISDAVVKLDELQRKMRSIEEKLFNLKQLEAREIVIGKEHRRLMDHYYATLEYATGAPLNKLSLLHWNHDDSHTIKGSHMTVREGFRKILAPLELTKNGQNKIRFNHIVREIKYNDDGCVLIVDVPKTENSQEYERTEFKADAIICTIPIGILKKSVAKENGVPIFTPPLPEQKISAIETIGAGLVNKLFLLFERPFWENQIDHFGYFGSLTKTERSRGEFFSFMVANDSPTLAGLLSGDAANLTTQIAPELLAARAMAVLQKIFGGSTPKEPVAVHVSKWHEDPYAACAFSYLGKEGLPELYDILAEPVTPADEVKEGEPSTTKRVPRLYFAGEHTSRQYPGTVHGAFLTGLREAARIADTFLGQKEFLSDVVPECVTLDSDEEEDEKTKQ
ncbi:unnamed protein product, partial [Mesorhabditis belari]|uniref:SWIRM domain-containing protein n=1 Tax=Mesorhabditis belari TaxID=2138241 RepID=A0AAF3J2V2_9BILA